MVMNQLLVLWQLRKAVLLWTRVSGVHLSKIQQRPLLTISDELHSVGRSDCPYFSKVELLGDRLVKNLPSFQLHKIVKTPEEWENWVSQTCKDRGWDHKTSPLIWRELIDRGGKGVLIGGASDFQEYVNGYYGLESELKSQDMRFIAEENAKTKQEVDAEEAHFRSLSKPLHICLSGASSPTCYALISSITSGEVFGLYGVPEGLVFSYPVTLSPSGYWTVVQDMNLTPETFEKLKETIQDLKTELEVIYPPPYVPPPTPPEEPEEEEPPVEEPPAEEQPSEAPSAMTLPGESSGADKDQDDENQEDHPDADAENEEAENEEAENEAEDD
nr:hypothetical protein BaRGS_032546 [Batillaria attramentaria]